jgi:hypothetical protein
MSIVRLARSSAAGRLVEIPKARKSSKTAGENSSGREPWAIERWELQQ